MVPNRWYCAGRGFYHRIQFKTTKTPIIVVNPPMQDNYDFLIIGSGIAGLTFALKVGDFGSVAIVTKEGVGFLLAESLNWSYILV